MVHDGRVCLLVRAEDHVGRYGGTSRIGLATSTEVHHFELESEPVLAPGDDRWQAWEWPGGCEDPPVVESPDGGYVCAYTAFDGKVGSLFVATSPDLRCWTKHGPAFAKTPYVRLPSKAGAIITELKDGRLVAARIEGRGWMYWGEGVVYAATSDDLVRWTPLETDTAPDRYLTWNPGRASAPVRLEDRPRARDHGSAPDRRPPPAPVRLAVHRTWPAGRGHRGGHRADLQRRQPSHRRRTSYAAVRLPAGADAARRR